MLVSDKRTEAERRLPVELKTDFSALIDDYMNASEVHTKDRSRRVNYNILVDLLLKGWRKIGPSN